MSKVTIRQQLEAHSQGRYLDYSGEESWCYTFLEADNVSEGIITQLWDAGYQTIEDILNVSQNQLEKIDRFGKRKAQIVYNSIQKSIKDVQLSKLMHASGLFRGLGSKKLALLEHFTTKPTID